MAVLRLISCAAAAAISVCAQSAGELSYFARQAEKKGEFAKAYLLYAQAAAEDPRAREYWAKAQALQTKALEESMPVPAAVATDEETPGPSLLGTITDRDLEEARRPLPPVELQATPGRKSFDIKGDAKQLFLDVAHAFGLDAVFDGDYQPATGLRFRVDDVDYRDALRSAEAATGSFIVPLGPKLFFVVKDTTQKRTEAEPTAAMVVQIPEPVSVQEAQEMARTVQQAMEIQRFTIDSTRRLVLLKDRVPKARMARMILAELMRHRPQVFLEVELLDVNNTYSSSFGLTLPATSALINFGQLRNISTSIPSAFSRFLTFGAGKTLFGLGVTDASLFANFTESTAQSLLRASLRSVDGQPATLHVGDRYPVITQGYYGPIQGPGQVYTPPPTFNFEDLGLVLKITPHIHPGGEVSMEIESEFKVLTGQTLNGIPVISNRKLISKVRLKDGEWAVVGGLLSSSEGRSLSGIAGLAGVPLLGALTSQHGRDRSAASTLLVIKPRIIDSGPADEPTPTIWVGSEARLLTQM